MLFPHLILKLSHIHALMCSGHWDHLTVVNNSVTRTEKDQEWFLEERQSISQKSMLNMKETRRAHYAEKDTHPLLKTVTQIVMIKCVSVMILTL